MRLALRASHMVTASVLLDHDLALRALLDVPVIARPILQQPLLGILIPMHLPLLTAEPVVVLSTGYTNGREARSAPENTISKISLEGVDFWTVRGGAVPELLRVAIEVVQEGDFQQPFDLGRREESLYNWKGNGKTTIPLVAHTRQGELFGVGGGGEEVAEATVTVSVATS